MKILLSWLCDYVETGLGATEIANILSDLGLPYDRIETPVLSCLPPRLASRDAEAGESKNGGDSPASVGEAILSIPRQALTSPPKTKGLELRRNRLCLTLSLRQISPKTSDLRFAASHADAATPTILPTANHNHPNTTTSTLSANRATPTIHIAAIRMNVPSSAKWLRRNCAVPTPSSPPDPTGKQ